MNGRDAGRGGDGRRHRRAEQAKRFLETYREKAGAPVSFLVQGGYDAFQLVVSALQETDGAQDAIVEHLITRDRERKELR